MKALQRIHQKLDNPVELYKLHLKHYHMSISQFKRRTSQLQLPKTINDKYEQVVKKCEVCQREAQAPSRSRVTGLRAENFGDLLFLDHCEVKGLKKKKEIFLLLLDGASHLLSAKHQKSAHEDDTQEQVRIWMDTFQCVPKAVCADEAFMTPSWQDFWAHHSIKTLPLGPRTPWPNRAETAVRLFKRQYQIMLRELQLHPELKTDAAITHEYLARKACGARNSTLTFSGKTPLELGFGRRPRDIVDVENATPEQMTTRGGRSQQRDVEVQKLAMRAHHHVRQLKDLQRDIAQNLRPSDGPFRQGDKIFWWNKDTSKLKTTGVWTRGTVVSQKGPIVSIDTGKTCMRMNQSKLRKDHDEWPDVTLPLDPPQLRTRLLKKSRPSSSAALVADQDAASAARKVQFDSSQDSQPPLPRRDEVDLMASIVWQVCLKEKLNFLELFSGSARASAAVSQEGLSTGPPVDLRTGFDLNTKAGQAAAWQLILKGAPDVVWMAPKCTPWCAMTRMMDPWKRQKAQKDARPMVQFCVQVALYQISKGRWFILENPEGSDMWYVKIMQSLLEHDHVQWGNVDMCAHGLRDPLSKKKYRMTTSLVYNLPYSVMEPLLFRCSNRADTDRSCGRSKTKKPWHEHETIEGWAKGFGKRTVLSQVYTWMFCKRLARQLADFLKRTGNPRVSQGHENIIADLCEDFEDSVEANHSFLQSLDDGMQQPQAGLNMSFETIGSMTKQVLPLPCLLYTSDAADE